MQQVELEGKQIGAVWRFVGNKPSERWVAYSINRLADDAENSARFPTRKAAVEGLCREVIKP
jgi:hypothetical protein